MEKRNIVETKTNTKTAENQDNNVDAALVAAEFKPVKPGPEK
jgi:hypothetical protein